MFDGGIKVDFLVLFGGGTFVGRGGGELAPKKKWKKEREN